MADADATAADAHALRAAFAATRQRCRRDAGHGVGGAYLASFFLPRPKRDGVYAVWAFARLVEQAIGANEAAARDSCSGAGSITPLLKSRIDAMYDSPHIELPLPQFRDSTQWTLLATRQTVRRFEIPRTLWHGFIDGVVAFAGVQRIATWRSLDSNLAASGGNVARMIAAVLGATHSDAGHFAAAIGRALGLASVLRDLKRDLAHDRILLPLEDLARFRYSEREMRAATINDNFHALIRHQLARARELLREGVAGTCWLADDGSRMAAAALVSLHLAQLDAIERDPAALMRDAGAGAGAVKRVSRASQLRQLPRAWRIARRRSADAPLDLR